MSLISKVNHDSVILYLQHLIPSNFKPDTTNPLELKWTPRVMMEKWPDLALVIDLTNTTKYYHPSYLQGYRTKQLLKAKKDEQKPNCIKSNVQLDNSQTSSKLVEPSLYSPSSVEYVKIFTQGHTVPNAAIVKRCSNYFASHKY